MRGLCNSPDIFQEKMSELFIGLDTVRVYIDNLLHVTKGSWTEHLSILEEMFTRLQKAGIKVNARKFCFDAHKFDYLGYHVTREGVMPILITLNSVLSQNNFAQLSPNGASMSINDFQWGCATVPTSSKERCLNYSLV